MCTGNIPQNKLGHNICLLATCQLGCTSKQADWIIWFYLILSDSVNQQIPLPTPTWGVQHVEHVDKHGGQPYAPSLRSLEKGWGLEKPCSILRYRRTRKMGMAALKIPSSHFWSALQGRNQISLSQKHPVATKRKCLVDAVEMVFWGDHCTLVLI